MNLLDRREQVEFFHAHLARVLPDPSGIFVAASAYEEEWSAMRFMTAAGPIIVRTNDIEKPDGDISHKTGFVARLLAECGDRAPEDFIRADKSLFDAAHANFVQPVACPGGAEVFAWDATRKDYPRPFYIRRWVEGPNLAIMPKARYFKRAGAALRRFHALCFSKYYASFADVAANKPAPVSDLLSISAVLEPVRHLLPPVTVAALERLSCAADDASLCLVSNSFFGSNVLIDNTGKIRVLDWERAGIGDAAQDFFPLKYWTVVDRHSGWYVPQQRLFDAFCSGYGARDAAALMQRPLWRCLEIQWLLQRLGAASRRWTQGGVREPYPEPDFYISCLRQLLDS